MTEILDRAKAAGCPVTHFEIAPPRPAGFYHRSATEFRDGGPIWINSLAQGFWMLTTHELCREMYQRPDIFCSDSITPQEPDQAFKLIPTNINPPEHKDYRAFLNPWFSPNAVRRAEDNIRSIARRLVEKLAPTGGSDVVQEFCLRLPTEAFLSIVGLPLEDSDDFVEWVEDFFRGFSGEEALERGDGEQPKMAAAVASIAGYMQGIIEDRRTDSRDPETDFFTAMVNYRIDGRLLTDDELQSMALLLVIAGLDTTRAHLGWLLFHLAQNPQDRQRMLDDPEIVPLAVEESLRYYAMIFGNGRKVAQDVTWHGAELKKGDMVFGLNTAANRDPAVYDEPDTFRVDRRVTSHLGFAAGPHRCLGSHFARAELRIAIEEFHRLIPNYAIAPGANLTERGVELSLHSLPLVWPTS